jgi:hypothetical protein
VQTLENRIIAGKEFFRGNRIEGFADVIITGDGLQMERLWALLWPLACCIVFWWARKEGHWVKKTEKAPKPMSSIP